MKKEQFEILMYALYSNNQLFIPQGQTIEGWIDNAFIDEQEEAINYSQCCTELPTKEEMNNRLYALANELKTDDKQTEKIYFEAGFRYCQQVIKEHLTK